MESSKICPKCKKEKTLFEFGKDKTKKDGLHCYCKDCARKHGRSFYKKNKAKIIAKSRAYYKEHRQEASARCKLYQQTHKKEIRYNKKLYRQSHKKEATLYRKTHKKEMKVYQQNNRLRINKKYRDKRKTNIAYKINRNISTSIWKSLKSNKNGISWTKCVGYNLNQLIKHLKSTLPKGYTWDDYINGAKLHIDHIIPMSVFNITSINCTDFKRCWALKNLQLLPALENISKGAKLFKPFQPSLNGL